MENEMLTCEYIVERIDGDYAMLRRTDDPECGFKNDCKSSFTTGDHGRYKAFI